MTAEQLAAKAAEALVDRLAEDVVVLDLRHSSPVTDFFVVATATSTIHAQALGRDIVELLGRAGERVHHVEGLDNAHWVLLDYVDVVVHIFLSEVRLFYGLERLWGDAPQRSFGQPDGTRRTTKTPEAQSK